MILSQLREIENNLSLSTKELLLHFSAEIPAKVRRLLIDGSDRHFAYFDDVSDSASADKLDDRLVDEKTVKYFSTVEEGPCYFSAEQLKQHTQFDITGNAWLLPLLTSDESRLKVAPIKNWLLLIDCHNVLKKIEVENIFLKLGWALTCLRQQHSKQELARANAWITQELEEMSRLQQLMLPDENTHIPGSKIAFTYRALKGAGGDYLDFLSLAEDKSSTEPHEMGIIVADVTGHGPSAAVEAAMLDAILRTFKPTELETAPAQVLNYINQHFFTRKERSSFLTANIIRYCPKTRMIAYANAGHPHAYIKRGQELIPLKEGGIPVGVIRDYQWQSHTINVQKDDILFVYTDVVIETKSPGKGDFGFDRLEKALREANNEPQALINYVEQQLSEFCLCTQFQDDLTMCAIQFTE
jgi:sigma-B regulation protein RsbU (phosphoserine phosphatase)